MHTHRHFNFPPPSFVASALLGRALRRICSSTASRSPVLTRGGICVPPTVTYLPYRVSGLTLTAVGRSQLLTRWPGTLFRILSGIQRAAQPVLGVYLKRTCSRDTSASSALGVLSDYALYKSTHSLSQSLASHESHICSLLLQVSDKKLCYRRRAARRTMSVRIVSTVETNCTTNPQQIAVMELESYN